MADAIVSVITVLTLVFFWLTGHQRLQRFVLAQLPAARRAGVRDGWNEVEARMGLWVRGQLILMTSIFAMTTVAYFVLGLPNALLLGLIAGIAELIPIVGPALGAIPALFVALLSGQPEKALLVAGVYLVIQVLEGNVLVPFVMRSTIGVPPFLVVLSLLIGAAVAGLAGALLAVPFAAALVVILERVQERAAAGAARGVRRLGHADRRGARGDAPRHAGRTVEPEASRGVAGRALSRRVRAGSLRICNVAAVDREPRPRPRPSD